MTTASAKYLKVIADDAASALAKVAAVAKAIAG